jgi:hypothetical protein
MLSRYRFLVPLVVCWTILPAWAAGLSPEDCGAWHAGTAKIEITPEKDMWMAGYASRDRPAEGKLTDLWAKALVLEDAQSNRAVLVTLDVIGVSRELTASVCETLRSEYGLERRQIAFCASHTHTGPALQRNLSPLHYLVVDPAQRALIKEYTALLEKKLVQVVGLALASRQPVQLSWGSGTATFAVNRRNNRPEQRVPQLRAEGKLQGPCDHDVPVLAVKDSSGRPVAVVFGYACHATVLSFYQWSGDYPGFAQIELEKKHPGCLAMFWAGCGADQNPLPRRSVELAIEYGSQLAAAVDAVLAGETSPVAPGLRATFREIDLPLAELPSREQVAQEASSDNRFVAARAKMLLQQMSDGRPLRPSYPYPIQVWRLGEEVQFVILGGEVVVDYALRLKAELGGRRTWVAGYANDVMAYIASRRVLREGGYEGGGAMVYYGLPTAWAPDSEQMIVEEVHRQVGS